MTGAGLAEPQDMSPGSRRRGYRRTPPLSARPALSEPGAVASEPARGRAQPLLSLTGLVFVVPLFFLLAFGAGGAERSLEVLAPLTTFALPAIAMIAFWWEDWPGSSLRAGWAGLTDTLIIVVAGVVLALAGQAIVATVDVHALFDPDLGAGHVTTFPHTMPLAAGAFVAMLQLTMVSEGWPLRGLGRVRSGVAALLVSWVVAVAAYLILLDVHDEPVALPGGLRDLAGPVAPGAYGAWLTAVGVWQLVFFMALRGWPFSAIRRRGPRLLTGNAVVLACGWATYLVMRHGLGWPSERVFAVSGCAVAALLVVAMLFEAWPWIRLLSPLPGRTCVLVSALVLTGLLYGGLTAYAGNVEWVRAAPDDWVGYVTLNALGMSVILHVAIWRRWPVATGTRRERSR
ncbi:hypothetical protein Pth03_17520 [Planotetraspora thailandica]|uniref:Uncharacterized protein n=1 Tax=Planotetraspora thailandica TaxID=487172 RepID=A0A8J3UY37_9ACTN|nr:hypothetical protein [Planotetraspora thailandica]GII53363.1 hypothetical protein Pth03_17520 [Planotetraspora thailandica]